jgi:hypothetical protein
MDMDSQRFDSLTMSLARGVTRRCAMKAMLGGAVAGVLVPLAGRRAAAGACGDNCDCPKNSICFNGACTTGKYCTDRTYRKLCKFSAGSAGCINPRAETCPNACAG